MKIGIIGSGIAGLTAAWLFQQDGHQVTLYERSATIGMGQQSVNLELEGIAGRVDVPLRGFNPQNWPNLIGLCRTLQVEIEPLDISHSFNHVDGSTMLAYHNVDVSRPYGSLLQKLDLLKPTPRQILADLLRFKNAAQQDMHQTACAELSLKAYLDTKQYSIAFVYGCLYPALGTICTCSYSSLDAYPVSLIIDFLEHMLGTMGLYRVKGGTHALINRLIEPLTDIRYDTPVIAVRPAARGATLQTATTTELYDHVIIATQANHAWKLLDDPQPVEIETLQCFPYDSVEVVVHTDSRFMPTDSTHWGMINFVTSAEHHAAMSTIWMNRVEQAWRDKAPLYQTVMPLFEPEPTTIISHSYFERAVVTQSSQLALHTLAEMHQQPNRRVWFSGSYAAPGIPLLESGVNASVTIAKRLDVTCPWG